MTHKIASVGLPAGSNPAVDATMAAADATWTADPHTVAPAPVAAPGAPADPLLFGNPERYELIAEHGRGGLGRVSRAHDRGLGRDVAIKELLSRGPVSEVRFLREALITARLEHPGIVPVHEAGRWADGTPFYAMKLVSGRPLRDLIAERATVDERIGLLHHVIAVADAIAYAHDRNIIHRDLKPANVIVGDFGETIVIDWGIAKDLTAPEDAGLGGGTAHTTPDDGLTAAGAVLGTPTYMAPEQERGEPVDQRADVFAIGAMLWELCALDSSPPTDTHQRHRMLRAAGIDHDLATIIDKALAPDPERRYRHAGALAADLKAFKSGARITARSYSPLAMIAHWTRRHRALAVSAIAFATLLVASVIALAVLYRSSSRNAEIAMRNAGTASQNARTASERLIQSFREQGRRLLLDGEYLRALPYLSEAYTEGDRSTAVKFLLARAERLASARLGLHRHAVQTAKPNDRAVVAAFRPDGSHVLSVADTGEAAIWDGATGHVVAELAGRPGGPYYSKVSRDGAFVAIALPDGVTLWDGVHPRTIATGGADRLAIDDRGQRIAVARGSELSAWSVATGERLWTASIQAPAIQLWWSGDRVLAVGVDTVARLVGGRGAVTLPTRTQVYAAVVDRVGMIATIGPNEVDIFDAAGTRRGKLTGRADPDVVAFSPDAHRAAVGGSDGVIRIYEIATGTLLGELTAHRGGFRAIEFSDDGGRLASAGIDQEVKIWDVAGYRRIASLLGAHDLYALGWLRFDSTATRLVASTATEAFVFAAGDPDVQASALADETIERGQFIDEARKFTTSAPHAFRIWSTATGAELDRIDLGAGARTRISPDGTLISIVGRAGDGIDVRDVATRALRVHIPGAFRWCSFDPRGERLVAATPDNVLEVWNLRGERLAAFRGHGLRVTMAAFSPDGRTIVSSSLDRTARIWDAASGRELGRIAADGDMTSAVFDPTGTRLLTSSQRTIRLWDIATQSQLRSFESASYVRFAAMNGDGSLVGCTAADGSVNIWDATTSSLLAQFRHTAMPFGVAFSPNSDLLITSADDRRATVWRLGFESGSPEAVAAFVRCRSPYRLVETRLEPATPVCSD